MSDIPERIIAYKREEIAMARSRMSEAAVLAAAADATPIRGFAAAFASRSAEDRIGLIAEIK